jgi:hypothetical protein
VRATKSLEKCLILKVEKGYALSRKLAIQAIKKSPLTI